METIAPSYAQIFVSLLQLWPLWAILVAILTLRIALDIYKQRQLLRSGIVDIDQMLGGTFERYLVAVFRRLGYPVEHTGRVGDYGADLIIVRNGVRTIVQAKRWSKKVGVKAVQEAVAAKGMYRCLEAMVITNSVFTQQARTLARANNVELWDRQKLVKMLQLLPPADKDPINTVRQSAAPVSEVQAQAHHESQALSSKQGSCAYCGIAVSDKVRQYCETNRDRFQGAIYCYQHQRNRPTPLPN